MSLLVVHPKLIAIYCSVIPIWVINLQNTASRTKYFQQFREFEILEKTEKALTHFTQIHFFQK